MILSHSESFAQPTFLLNSGHCEEQSDVVRQSTLADGLSTCFEIASSAKGLWRTRNDNTGIFQRSHSMGQL